MPIELILILGLVLVFVVPIVFDINVGVVAFVAAFLIGTLILGKTSSEVLSGFPVNIFVMFAARHASQSRSDLEASQPISCSW
jgi:hypothetical protein